MKRRWLPAWTTILLTALGLRLLFGLLGAWTVISGEPQVLAPGPTYDVVAAQLAADDFSRQFINPWLRWDTVWYLKIANFGMDAADGSSSFAPLYPFLARLCGGSLTAALTLSTLFTALALILLYELFERKFAVVAALLLFPTAFFLFAAYTESLFLLLAVAAFLFARRGCWGWAGMMAGLAALARFQGIVLSAALFWMLIAALLNVDSLAPREQVRAAFAALTSRAGWRRLAEGGCRWLAPILPVLTLCLYLIGLRAAGYGSPSATLAQIWGIRTVAPWTGFALFLQRLFNSPRVFIDWVDLSALIFMGALSIAGLKRLRPEYSLYVWGSLALLFMRGTPPHLLDSFSRYLLLLFPLFSLAAQIRSRVWRLSLAGISAGLQLLLALGYFDWRWIA